MSYLRAGRSSSKPPKMSAVADAGAVRRLGAAKVWLLIDKRYPKSRADASARDDSARDDGTMSWGCGCPEVTTVERTSSPNDSTSIRFRCNICGDYSRASLQALRNREAVSCKCGSTLRFRAVINGLSIGLFGKQIALPDFPIRRDMKGIGLSDADVYAEGLSQKFTYTNTFLHTSPQLDITDIDTAPFKEADFVIASDVFEHVRPPVDLAFKNVRRLLKTGGVFVFSVPYVPGTTVEHFPDLHDYKIDSRDGRFVLTNQTIDGYTQEFQDLVFHGGPGSTLEMRLFGFTDLVRHFRTAGFGDPTVLSFNAPQFGIDFSGEVCSIPMIAHARSTVLSNFE